MSAVVTYAGPTFERVTEIAWDDWLRRGHVVPSSPLLVKGAVRAWPAFERWTFERLGALRKPDGSDVMYRFSNGIVEQGATRPPIEQPVGPYIQGLAKEPAVAPDAGLMPYDRWKRTAFGERFHLDWSYMDSFDGNQVYLAQWNILDEYPGLRQDFRIPQLWPGLRKTWEYVFIGPARTVTGLHYDFPNNWFCQVRGVKEMLLFPPQQTPYLSQSSKFDWGGTLSHVNIVGLDRQPEQRETFAKAHGIYARVEEGDALFIPKRTWHAVVSLAPSVSLGVFGLTPFEMATGGVAGETKRLLHAMHLYRWGNCTCHGSGKRY